MAKNVLRSEVSDRIREARKRRGWSQAELGGRAGVSRPSVARIEGGLDVSIPTLVSVAGALGLTVRFTLETDE